MKGINMDRKIKTYTEEFKQECVTLALKSESISQTAKDFGIPEGTLYSWVKSTTQNTNSPMPKKSMLDLLNAGRKR